MPQILLCRSSIAYNVYGTCRTQFQCPSATSVTFTEQFKNVKLYISMQGLLAQRRCRGSSACFSVLKNTQGNKALKCIILKIAQYSSTGSPARVPSGRALPQTESRIRKPGKEEERLKPSLRVIFLPHPPYERWCQRESKGLACWEPSES